MKYFKLVHAPTWKILHYMIGFLSICTRHEAFGFFDCFALSATLLCLVRSIVLEKDEIYFKLVHAPTWKIPQYMNCFLFICTRHRVRYLQLFFAICDSLMLCKVHNFGKRWFFHEIFQVVHAPTWKIPQYMKFLLFISIYFYLCLVPSIFWKKMIFSWNISSWCMPQLERFLNIWTVYYSYVQDIDVGIFNFFFAICDSLMLCKVHCFGKRWFFHEIFQVGASHNLKDS